MNARQLGADEGEKGSVLIADGSLARRVRLKRLLETMGFTAVAMAATAEEARQRLRDEPVAIILGSAKISGASGVGFVQSLAQSSLLDRPYFILMDGGQVSASAAGWVDDVIKGDGLDQAELSLRLQRAVRCQSLWRGPSDRGARVA